MVFNSGEYLFFLALVFGLYWSARRVGWQNLVLLAASYAFYARWDWRFLALLLFVTGVNYAAGLLLARVVRPGGRRCALAGALLANLGVLGFFKYFNFFSESAAVLLASLGLRADLPTLNFALPVGISFYTFQAMAYTLDVYRGKLAPTRRVLDFALFAAFFPQLLAGPIERAGRMLPQIRPPDGGPRVLLPEQVETGLILILLGLFKKIAIADVAASLIDPAVFSEPGRASVAAVVSAVYLFALQLYGDFSAYSDIARGSARLLGFDLMENFNQPYFAQTVSEFWQRWHISLSSWLRDYLFFPISRALLPRLKRGLHVYAAATLVTMLLAGLWHGAAWTFVLWGGLLGLYLVVSRLFVGRALGLRRHPNAAVRVGVVVARVLLTFHLILLAWVLFRAPSLEVAGGVYARLAALLTQGLGTEAGPIFLPVLLLYAVTGAIDAAQVITGEHSFTRRLPLAARSALYAGAIFAIVIFLAKPYVPFIYFQF